MFYTKGKAMTTTEITPTAQIDIQELEYQLWLCDKGIELMEEYALEYDDFYE